MTHIEKYNCRYDEKIAPEKDEVWEGKGYGERCAAFVAGKSNVTQPSWRSRMALQRAPGKYNDVRTALVAIGYTNLRQLI